MKAVSNIRGILKDSSSPMTLRDIQAKAETLKANEISMALCYLMRMRYLTRELVDNSFGARKRVWSYTYHQNRLPKA